MQVPNGVLHVNESKADCPYCTKHVPIEDAERVLQIQVMVLTSLNALGVTDL